MNKIIEEAVRSKLNNNNMFLLFFLIIELYELQNYMCEI